MGDSHNADQIPAVLVLEVNDLEALAANPVSMIVNALDPNLAGDPGRE